MTLVEQEQNYENAFVSAVISATEAKNQDPKMEFVEESDRVNDVQGIAGKRLLAFLERIERLEEEKAALAEDIKEVYAEAKSVGFYTKTMKKLIKLRKINPEKRREEDELLELYRSAVGLL